MSSHVDLSRLNNLKSRLPNKVLDNQLAHNLPLQRTPKTLKYPNPQLFDKTANVETEAVYPYVHLATQPFDPDAIPPEQHHAEYVKNRIPRCFPRVNPYHRHYMPNRNKPWMFDTDFQLFPYWLDHHETHYKVWNESGAPFPQDRVPDKAQPKKPRKREPKRRDPWTEWTNPLDQPFMSINPPDTCMPPYDHQTPKYSYTSLSPSCYYSD